MPLLPRSLFCSSAPHLRLPHRARAGLLRLRHTHTYTRFRSAVPVWLFRFFGYAKFRTFGSGFCLLRLFGYWFRWLLRCLRLFTLVTRTFIGSAVTFGSPFLPVYTHTRTRSLPRRSCRLLYGSCQFGLRLDYLLRLPARTVTVPHAFTIPDLVYRAHLHLVTRSCGLPQFTPAFVVYLLRYARGSFGLRCRYVYGYTRCGLRLRSTRGLPHRVHLRLYLVAILRVSSAF